MQQSKQQCLLCVDLNSVYPENYPACVHDRLSSAKVHKADENPNMLALYKDYESVIHDVY
jgi:hypothetical protein